jgi:hypothetical protein
MKKLNVKGPIFKTTRIKYEKPKNFKGQSVKDYNYSC